MWSGLPVVIFGSGGISKEVFKVLQEINHSNKFSVYDCLGFVEDDCSKLGNEVLPGVQVVTCDAEFACYVANKGTTLGVVIPFGNPKIKSKVYDRIKDIDNIVFPNIIHPNAQFDVKSVHMGFGNVITPGANLTCDINIGNFNLINLNSTVGHDTRIGDFNVINPLVAVSGDVEIGNCCLIGTGAKILQQLALSDNVTVGAGAVVVKSVEADSTVVGVPAKKIK